MRAMADYDLIETSHVPIKAWTRGVGIEPAAQRQLENTARLPIVFRHVAVMPDVHFGIGATVGSVIATMGAIIPAAVGVDIGCGMMSARSSVEAGRASYNQKLAFNREVMARVSMGSGERVSVSFQYPTHWRNTSGY